MDRRTTIPAETWARLLDPASALIDQPPVLRRAVRRLDGYVVAVVLRLLFAHAPEPDRRAVDGLTLCLRYVAAASRGNSTAAATVADEIRRGDWLRSDRNNLRRLALLILGVCQGRLYPDAYADAEDLVAAWLDTPTARRVMALIRARRCPPWAALVYRVRGRAQLDALRPADLTR